jgi:hypothetical protein
MKALMLAFVIAAGCASAPADREAAEYERVDSKFRATERYQALRQACRASGGVIFLDRTWGRFPVSAREMATAKCSVGTAGGGL